MAELEKLRLQIDEISLEILDLLNKRAEIVKKIGLEKEKLGIEVSNPLREKTLNSILCKNNKGPFSNEAIKRIFKTIYDESKDIQIIKDDNISNVKIDLGNGVFIGKGCLPAMIAGPCSVESEEQLDKTASFVSENGVKILRGGAYKPRTSPYSFQGIGEDGLKLLQKYAKKYDMLSVSEATTIENLKNVARYCDIIQIGARSMYSYPLLEAVGKIRKPVILKRHFSATIKEFLLSAEYIRKEGNKNIILCERGIRTFETSTRNTLDISSIPILKKESCYPVIVDLSHSAGRKDILNSLLGAVIGVGADGVMVETHINPNEALSDGNQQMDRDEFFEFMNKFRNFISNFQN